MLSLLVNLPFQHSSKYHKNKEKCITLDGKEFESFAGNIFPVWQLKKQKTASSRSPTRASNRRVVSEILRG